MLAMLLLLAMVTGGDPATEEKELPSISVSDAGTLPSGVGLFPDVFSLIEGDRNLAFPDDARKMPVLPVDEPGAGTVLMADSAVSSDAVPADMEMTEVLLMEEIVAEGAETDGAGIDIPAVAFRLHPQAPAEIGIGRHLLRHHAGRLLGHNHRIDAQGTASAEHMVQRACEIRKLGLEFCELINDQNQERHPLHIRVLSSFFQITPDVADSVLIEDPLAALHLALQSQKTASHILIQVGDASRQMGKPLKGLQKAGSLEIHQDKIHVLRRKLQGHGGDPALRHL